MQWIGECILSYVLVPTKLRKKIRTVEIFNYDETMTLIMNDNDDDDDGDDDDDDDDDDNDER